MPESLLKHPSGSLNLSIVNCRASWIRELLVESCTSYCTPGVFGLPKRWCKCQYNTRPGYSTCPTYKSAICRVEYSTGTPLHILCSILHSVLYLFRTNHHRLRISHWAGNDERRHLGVYTRAIGLISNPLDLWATVSMSGISLSKRRLKSELYFRFRSQGQRDASQRGFETPM